MTVVKDQKEMEKVPKLRFPEFGEEWEEKRLGEISETPLYGMNASSKKFDGKNIYLRITDIDEKSRQLKRDKLTSPDAELKDEYKLKEGDLLFVRTGASVGKTYLYKPDDGILYFAGFLIKFSIESTDPYFVYLQTLQKRYYKWVESVSMRTGQPGINAKDYAKFKIALPNLKEQQKIADFLSSVDEWINSLKGQKEKLEAYKKCMMQKIFSQEIRFKDDDGNDFPEWEEKRLGEIGSSYNGLSGKNAEDFGEGQPFITYKQIFDSSRIDVKNFAFVKIKDGEKQNQANFGDIFFTTSSETPTEVGFSSVFLNQDSKPYLNSFSFGFRPNSLEILYPKFSQFLFRSPNFRKAMVKLAQGSTRYNMSKIAFMKTKIFLPTLPEQQKIADFLSSLDKLIEAKQCQIIQTQNWKKGLMQQLFV